MEEKTIGSQLKEWRIKRGYKQKEFAEKVGIAPQNLSFYESGRRTVSIETLKTLCDALDLSITLAPNNQLL